MLSDAKARQIAPGGKSLAAGMVPGLYLRPSSARGQGSWFLRFVSPVTGRRRDLGLGAYPEVGIAQARKLAIEARSAIADGRDPIEARRIEAAETRAVAADRTFREAAQSVHAELRDGCRNAKHAA